METSLKKHGNNVSTIIIASYSEEHDLLTKHALNFSKLFNIIESSEWANLINENGLDGNCPGTKFKPETIEKFKKVHKGRPSYHKGKTLKEVYGDEKATKWINKMKHSKYHSSKTYEERFGDKRAQEVKAKISKKTAGKNNPNATKWKLISPDNEIIITNDLKTTLQQLQLPYGTLKDSAFYKRPVKRGKAKGWKLERTY